MTNFGAILDRPSAEIERPKPLPQGTYTCTVKGLPRYDKSAKKQTEFVEFLLQPLSAAEDVDEEALTAWATKGDGTSRSLMDTTIKATYYLTEDSIWRLKDFLNHCQIEEGEHSLRQRIEATPGCQVKAFIKHEASQDGTSVFAKLATTAAVE